MQMCQLVNYCYRPFACIVPDTASFYKFFKLVMYMWDNSGYQRVSIRAYKPVAVTSEKWAHYTFRFILACRISGCHFE